MPYAVLGTSDLLPLYKVECGQRLALAACGGGAACSIARVFAGEPPPAQHQQQHAGYDRQAAAARCGIQSTCLLAVYDERDTATGQPAAVFELAQHEPDVDFTRAVSLLASVSTVRQSGSQLHVQLHQHGRLQLLTDAVTVGD